jgi:HK97 family phage prohead protease
MKRSTKQYEIVQIKALGPDDGEPEGTFEAVVAVFGNVDKVGDRLNSKAFDNTLAEWRSKFDATGARIPVIFSHDWMNPMSYIGSADPYDVKAEDGALRVKAVIEHMDTNPVAEQVYKLMKSRVLTQFSFGYTVPKGGETRAKDGAYDLNEVGLFEFGPCLKGVNPETDLLAMKAALNEEARPERQAEADAKAALLRKSYVDVDMPGSYEETMDALRDAIRATYPADGAGTYTYVSIVATYADRVVYQVCTSGQEGSEEETYQASYTGDEDNGITLGEPAVVDFVAVPEEPEKAITIETEPGEGRVKVGEVTVDVYAEVPAVKADEPEAPEAEAVEEPEAEVKADDLEPVTAATLAETDHLINMARLAEAEHLVGKALSADAIEVSSLDRQLAAELALLDG